MIGNFSGVQVALHRSLTSLLKAAETRPVNWRRYCASPRLPRLDDAGASSALPGIDAGGTGPAFEVAASTSRSSSVGVHRDNDEGTLLAEFGSHSPVCLLFALCESGGGIGGRGSRLVAAGTAAAGPASSTSFAGELQSLLWQLLELTLQPEDLSTVARASIIEATGHGVEGSVERQAATLAQTPLSQTPLSPSLRQTSAGDGSSGAEPAANASEEGSPPGLVSATLLEATVAVKAASGPNPAQLLVARGLVGPDTLVAMAQDLLSPEASAEARTRTARVLHHLWAASPLETRPDVVHCLASHLPSAPRQGSRAREWLSFLVHAIADACPSVAVDYEPSRQTLEMEQGSTAAASCLSTLRALVRAATAAVMEQSAALRNHPNAALYAAISRIVPGAGHYLELEPCLVCYDQERSGEAAAGGPRVENEASGGGGGAAAAGTASAAPGAVVSGSGNSASGAGSGVTFMNHPLDSVKAASKSTESAILVSAALCQSVFLCPIANLTSNTEGSFDTCRLPLSRFPE